YLPTAKWAAPDIAVAARLMRYVHDHPEIAAERGKKGREDLLAKHSVGSAASFITGRLAEIRQQRQPISPPVRENNKQEVQKLQEAAQAIPKGKKERGWTMKKFWSVR
ncbi:MAG: glycosyltransferase, partial [Chthoniobacteraceae bacterium]